MNEKFSILGWNERQEVCDKDPAGWNTTEMWYELNSNLNRWIIEAQRI